MKEFTDTFEIEFNGNGVEVKATFGVYAESCGSLDPANKEKWPALDGIISIDSVIVGAMSVPIVKIIPANIEYIKEQITEIIKTGDYLKNLIANDY